MRPLFLCTLFLLPGLLRGQETPPSDSATGEARFTLSALLDGTGFARIPAGEFLMGSADGNADEQPVHRVVITKAFEMGRFEVTQAQWNAVMRNPHARPNTGEGADAMNPSQFKGASRPVENVPWNDVQQFLRTLNLRDADHVYRLPTEAEWEYAARAGSAEDRPGKPDEIAWYEPNSGGETHPVGEKAPNKWGLYDMIGNVLEWVQDWYGLDYYAGSAATDPQGPASGSYRVYRGGGWLSAGKYCRHAFRAFDFPNSGQASVGFRLVRTAKQAP